MRRVLKLIGIVLGVLVLLALVVPLVIPLPPLEGTVAPQELGDPDSRFAQVKGVDVHYKAAGSGPTALVLLHGFAASVFSWREVMPAWAQSNTVVAFDRPGFGLTERPLPGQWNGASPYSAEFQVDLTLGLMDRLGIERAVLVGNSMGGGIAALTAQRAPSRVQALILVDPAIYTGSMGNSGLVQWLLSTPQVRRVGPLFVRNVKDWGINFGKSAWHDPSRITPEIWAGYLKPLQADNWDVGLYEVQVASQRSNVAGRLAELKMPVLVVTGDDDHIVPRAQSERLARELPNAQLAVITNCGHVPQEECPAEFLKAANGFLGTLSQ